MATTAYNLIDKAIAIFDPARALRRAVARQSLGKVVARAYEGASLKDGWIPRRAGAGPNADHAADAPMLRHRARSLVQNNPYARKALDSLVANVVGDGIVPESRAKRASDRKVIDALWAEWAVQCDADGRADFNGLVAQAYRAMEQDGEVLIRLRTRRPEDGLAVPLQLQVLEIDYLDSTRNAAKGEAGGPIISGVELNSIGRVAAYWLFDSHPGDKNLGARQSASSRRILSESVIHLFAPDRPGQARGITRFAPVIARMRDLAIYEDAELARKQNEALLSVIVSGDGADFAVPGAGESVAAAQDRAALFGNLGSLAPGAVLATNGQNVTVAQPAAVGGYAEYVRVQLYALAAGLGVTYEMLTGDLSLVNFSSARVGLLEFRRAASQRQWHVLVPRLLWPIWRAFVDAAVLVGKLRAADTAVEWTPPKWQYVNPQQDAKADAMEIESGMSSLSEKLRQRGYQPDRVFAELGADFKKLKDSGALEALAFFASKKTAEPAPAVEPEVTQ
ncbi:phage portal protein [Aromatoleum toluclasticum]|uniref:phage portal protein n=1 Tax=Aromatoleum toluclasticum TaxID=92003 RepID=UPI00037753EF|nr:phage portal protein [Aromatoleum toluclasticum]